MVAALTRGTNAKLVSTSRGRFTRRARAANECHSGFPNRLETIRIIRAMLLSRCDWGQNIRVGYERSRGRFLRFCQVVGSHNPFG